MIAQDTIGIFKLLHDGRVLRVNPRQYNTLLTLSSSARDPGWSHGW